VALTTYTYQQAVLDTTLVCTNRTWGSSDYNNPPTGFAGGGNLGSLIGHWPMNEVSGTTMTDTSGNGINGTYRGVNSGNTTVGNGPLMIDASGSYSAYFDGDYNNGGASIPYNASASPNINAFTTTINAWVKVETIPTAAIALSVSATAVSGSTNLSISLPDQAWTNITTAVTNTEPVSVIITGAASGWLTKGSGQWIPTGATIVAASSGTPGTITLSKPVGTSGQITVNIISANQKYAFGRFVSKGNDYGFLASHFTGDSTWLPVGTTQNTKATHSINPVMTYYSGGLSRSTGEDTFYTTTPAMVTFRQYLDVGGETVEAVSLNGVAIETYGLPFSSTIFQNNPSTTSDIAVFQSSSNQLTSAAGGFTGYMQSLSISGANVGDWYLKLLYNLGVNGTIIYDPANPSYRYPGTLNGTTYSAPTNVYALPWPTTIIGQNTNRKRITITNDSDATIWLKLSGTDFTNPYDDPLWISRPQPDIFVAPEAIKPIGIQLEPHGGMWTSDFYQGMISAVANPWVGSYNLCVMEEVA
jgi:hypothetical protein